MSRRRKLEKFAEIMRLKNVVEYSEMGFDSGYVFDGKRDISLKGRWKEDFFKNNNDLVLELACGRGEYSCALGQLYPEKNFLGIDVKGARIWKGATDAENNGLLNVGFLRTKIEYISHYFDKNEVDEVWITFPDPFLKQKKENRRLTSPEFLDRYFDILKAKAKLHLKTDSDELYLFTLSVLENSKKYQLLEKLDNIYTQADRKTELKFKTYYEKMHLNNGKKIKYVLFQKR